MKKQNANKKAQRKQKGKTQTKKQNANKKAKRKQKSTTQTKNPTQTTPMACQLRAL